MPMVAYGPLFLYSIGLSNTAVGLFLAAASLLSIFLQPAIASLVDRQVLTLRKVILLHVLLLFALGLPLLLPLGLYKVPLHFGLLVVMVGLQPFINTLSIDANSSGYPVDFGIARGSASLIYGGVSLVVGAMLVRYDVKLLPLLTLIHLSLFALIFLSFPRTQSVMKEEEIPSRFSPTSNKSFLYMLLGTLFLFVNHGAMNNFLLRIVENVGGGAGELGIAIGISASVEMPMMYAFTSLRSRFGTLRLLQASALFFVIKSVVLYFAATPFLLYLNMAMQCLTFGLYFPSAVTFVQEILPYSLRARSQAMLVSTITLGGVIASVLGGLLLDLLGVPALLIASILFSALGFLFLLPLKEKRSR